MFSQANKQYPCPSGTSVASVHIEFESYAASEGTRVLAVCVLLGGEIGRNVSVVLSSADLSAKGRDDLFLHNAFFYKYRVVKCISC